MRRSASEVIRNLEGRIARLEKSARPNDIGIHKVVNKLAYIHQFSSGSMVLSVPSRNADEVVRAIKEIGVGAENPFEENDITYKKDNKGHMVTFTVSSPEWLRTHDVVLSLKLDGFFLVSHDDFR